GFTDLAQWQYETYRTTAREVLLRIAAAAGIEWSVPVDLLSRMLVVVNDGVVLAWLVDGDSAKARDVYAAFLQQIAAMAEPVGASSSG
ncbi:hypothetical protein, partial [Mumia sp.]